MADNITPTPYKTITDNVLWKLKSYDLATMTEREIDELLSYYIRPAIVKFSSCKQDLKDRNDTSKQFNIELTDVEIEILSNFVFIKYLEGTYINVPNMLQSGLLSTKDFSRVSVPGLLSRMMTLRDNYLKENYQLISVYSYQNSSLFSTSEESE